VVSLVHSTSKTIPLNQGKDFNSQYLAILGYLITFIINYFSHHIECLDRKIGLDENEVH
jgi:hypothetical protein